MQLVTTHFLLLLGAMLIALPLRLDLPLGKPLGDDYQYNQILAYALLFISVLVTYAVALLTRHIENVQRYLSINRPFRNFTVTIVIAVGLIAIFEPQMSRLQLVYFVIAALFLGFLVIVLPGRAQSIAYVQISLLDSLRQLIDRHYLITLWLRFRIQERYIETYLGVLWVVLLPLSFSIVMAFAFTQLLGVRTMGQVPFIAFLLSGLVVFRFFNTVVTKSVTILRTMNNPINQVYFPREVVIVVIIGEAIVDFLFMFIAMIIVNAILGFFPNANYIWLFVPFSLVVMLSAGVALFTSWLSILFRDLEQLVGVLMQLLFYTSVLYSSERVSPKFQFVGTLNPLTSIIEAYRDIILYNRLPEPSTLQVSFVLSIALLYSGYIFFKGNEERFVDFM